MFIRTFLSVVLVMAAEFLASFQNVIFSVTNQIVAYIWYPNEEYFVIGLQFWIGSRIYARMNVSSQSRE